jgi:acyl-CoA dehydrogenase
MSLPVYTLLCLGWSYLIVKHGSEELKREVLPKVASGEWFVGINTTEPQGGSDVSTITTTAVKKGDKWIINGEKVYISGVTEVTSRGGGHCSLVVTDPEKGHRGMTFIYIPANLPGITHTVYRDMGRMGLSTGGFVYKDVEVPDYCRLSEVGRGFHTNMEGFNVARIVVAAACTGAAEKMLEIGVDYTKQRVLFGRPLINFEGISFEVAEDHTDLEMTKLMLQKAAWMVDQFYAGSDEFAKADINKSVAMCKLRAPLLAARIAQHVMMQLGAFGYTKDCPVEMGLRGVLSYCVGAEGGQNIMKIIIARDYVGDEAIPYRGTQKQ